MALSKNEIKFVQALRIKKFRQKYDNFIVEGEKIAQEVLLQDAFAVQWVFAEKAWLNTHEALLAGVPVGKVREVTSPELGKISGLSTPNKVLLVIEPPKENRESLMHIEHKALFLDDIQDPGNLGAILRIADWFAIPKVFCSPGSVDIFNPKVVQASMGAMLRVKSAELPLESLSHANPGIPVMGAVLDGQNIFKAMLPSRGILVIGNESKGISTATSMLLTHRLAIPRAPGGGAESLNAAVAAGILTAYWQELY